MKHPVHSLRFSQKILIVFVLMALVLLVASGMIYYQYASKQIVENFNASTYDIMKQIEYTISEKMQALLLKTKSLLTNRVFGTTLVDYLSFPSTRNYVAALGTIADFLSEFTTSEELIHSILIHTDLEDFDSFSRNRLGKFNFDESEFSRAYQDPDSPPLQWFPLQQDCIFTRGEWVIPFVWKFSVFDLPGKSQYAIVQIDRNALANVLIGSFQSMDFAFVCDQAGNLVLGDEAAFDEIRKSLCAKEESWNGEVYFREQEFTALHAELEINDWDIFVLKSKAAMLDDMRAIRRRIWMTAAILLFISTCILCLILHRVTKSLADLSKRMCSVRAGDWSARFTYPYQDEVGELARSFNFMLDELESLLDKQNQSIEALREEKNRVADIQKQKRKAELAALQAQINPHFLYNTLNTITWQAVSSGDEKISTLSHALGRFFRLSLSRGAEIISVGEEMDHVKNYLLIQQIRYGDRLAFTVEAEEELLDYPIIKLVLQPLVENSIYHGIKMREGPGNITIRAFLKKQDVEVMCFEVQDDGAGIEPEKLRIINDDLRRVITRRSEGYGIYNVNERISLYYGPEYGLAYESKIGEGTTVRFSVPVLRWEECRDDSDCDRR